MAASASPFSTIRIAAADKGDLAYAVGALRALADAGELQRARVVIGAGMGNLPVLLMRQLQEYYRGAHLVGEDAGVLTEQLSGPLYRFMELSQVRLPLQTLVSWCAACWDSYSGLRDELEIMQRLSQLSREAKPPHAPLPMHQSRASQLASMQCYVMTGYSVAYARPMVLTTDKLMEKSSRVVYAADDEDPVVFAAMTSLQTGACRPVDNASPFASAMHADGLAAGTGNLYGRNRRDLLIDAWSTNMAFPSYKHAASPHQKNTLVCRLDTKTRDEHAERLNGGLGHLDWEVLLALDQKGYEDAAELLSPSGADTAQV